MSTTLAHVQATGPTVPSAETVALTSPVTFMQIPPAQAGALPAPQARVLIRGTLNITPGTTTSAVVVKVRQGTTTAGTQIGGSFTDTIAAAASGSVSYAVEDDSGLLAQAAGGQYCVTITQTAGTANGTLNQGDLEVVAIP